MYLLDARHIAIEPYHHQQQHHAEKMIERRPHVGHNQNMQLLFSFSHKTVNNWPTVFQPYFWKWQIDNEAYKVWFAWSSHAAIEFVKSLNKAYHMGYMFSLSNVCFYQLWQVTHSFQPRFLNVRHLTTPDRYPVLALLCSSCSCSSFFWSSCSIFTFSCCCYCSSSPSFCCSCFCCSCGYFCYCSSSSFSSWSWFFSPPDPPPSLPFLLLLLLLLQLQTVLECVYDTECWHSNRAVWIYWGNFLKIHLKFNSTAMVSRNTCL